MSTDWRNRHIAALTDPTPAERPIVSLVSAIDSLSAMYAGDYVMAPGVAQLIQGAIEMLNGSLGRLDGGSLSSELWAYAARIEFDLDSEEFIEK